MTFSGSMSASNVILPQKHPPSIFIWLHLRNARRGWIELAGFGPFNGPGTSDLVLRNTNTGAFEVYDIANNQITGASLLGTVGLDWQLGGFAADPPTAFMGNSGSQLGSAGSTSQLVQAMAS